MSHPERPLFICLVDDDEVYRELTRLQLERAGVGVIVKAEADPRKLLEGYYDDSQRRPDCIVLDVMMPGVDGFDVARAWRIAEGNDSENSKRVPIIIYTALGGVEYNLIKAKKAGADAYFTKPMDLVDFLQTVNTLLAKQ